MEKTNERKIKKSLAPDHSKVKKDMKKSMSRLLRRISNREVEVCHE